MKFCQKCGTENKNELALFCYNCGFRLEDTESNGDSDYQPAEIKNPKSRTMVVERADPTYYSDNEGVRITQSRLIIPGRNKHEGPSTFSMANITSVKMKRNEPKRWIGILFFVIGIIFLVIGLTTDYSEIFTTIITGLGVIFIVLGIAMIILFKPRYCLQVSSASGETEPLESRDQDYINNVITAINEALIKRG